MKTPRPIATAFASAFAALALTAVATPARADLSMSWFTIDCGGGVSTGTAADSTVFTMTAVIGQPDAAGVMSGSTYSVAGGYLANAAPPPSCPTDLNGDGVTNTVDLAKLLSHFGQNVPADTGGDLNGDGLVNTVDLAKLLSKFGVTCQ